MTTTLSSSPREAASDAPGHRDPVSDQSQDDAGQVEELLQIIRRRNAGLRRSALEAIILLAQSEGLPPGPASISSQATERDGGAVAESGLPTAGRGRLRLCRCCGGHATLRRVWLNHQLHLLLTVGTAGIWTPAWIFAQCKRWLQPLKCSRCGGRSAHGTDAFSHLNSGGSAEACRPRSQVRRLLSCVTP